LKVIMRVISIVAIALFIATSKAVEDAKVKATKYLEKYGYVEDIGDRTIDEEEYFSEAIKTFQEFAGLEVTGELDEETEKMMDTPRCGMDDRVANFVTQGSKWPKKDLTYRISEYPNGISQRDVDKTTRQAFDMWQDVSQLTFREGRSRDVDINIKFVRGCHGDGNCFNGPGGVLAHAYFPQFGGAAHFDATERWSVTVNRGTQLLNTLTHEFGHSLGLRHSRVRGAIMAPFYKGWDPNLKLGQDDIKGIQKLYGRQVGPTRPTRGPPRTTQGPRRPRPRPRPGNPDELCGSSIDAIVQTGDGSSYVFKGQNYWMITDSGVAFGYPRSISQDWPGLPSCIDAALTWRSRKITYFFKGDKYWRFTDQLPDPGYPKDISNWSGLPSNLDAAFQWGRNGFLYFFKGSQYWKYDTDLKKMSSGYPKDISQWQDVPGSVNAALQWSNGNTYFFKSGQYWRFNDDTISVDRADPAYPRDTGRWWFGCSDNSLPQIGFPNDVCSEPNPPTSEPNLPPLP